MKISHAKENSTSTYPGSVITVNMCSVWYKVRYWIGFDSASHSTKENAAALTPTHEGTCAIQNPSSSANRVVSQSIQEDERNQWMADLSFGLQSSISTNGS
jgi:hypothetical protein